MMRQPSVSPEPTEPTEPILLLIQFQRVSSETTGGPKAVSFHNSFALNSLAYVLPGYRGFRGTERGNLPDNHVPVLVRGPAKTAKLSILSGDLQEDCKFLLDNPSPLSYCVLGPCGGHYYHKPKRTCKLIIPTICGREEHSTSSS